MLARITHHHAPIVSTLNMYIRIVNRVDEGNATGNDK